MNSPIIIFYSYSHKDELFREEMEKHLTTLRHSGLVQEWHDRKILPGDEWDKQISKYLDEAEVILLLISPDFIASEYCYDIETKRALERSTNGEACLIPIILRPVSLNLTPFSKLQALPKNALPITLWENKDSAFVDILEGILKVVISLRSKAENSSSQTKSPNLPIRPLVDQSIVLSQNRVLDAAIPDHVTIGKTITLVTMIRSEESNGLRKILQVKTHYGVGEEDVNSSESFPLEFQLDSNGKPEPIDLKIKIESPDFEPKSQIKSIRILPEGDSDLRIFLLSPQRKGELFVNVELHKEDLQLTGCFLTTQSSQNDQEAVSLNLISARLKKADDRDLLPIETNQRNNSYPNKTNSPLEEIAIGDNTTATVKEETSSTKRQDEYQAARGETRQEQNRMLSGLFRDRDSIERAYTSLRNRGYTDDDINVMMSDDTRNNWFSDDDDSALGSKALEGAGAGSAIGGTLGAIIGGIAAIGTNVFLPGLGLVVAGPLAAALAGAGAGGLTGGLVGALIGSGIPEEHAAEYEQGIKEGGIVIGVTPRSAEDADYFENEWRNYRGEHIYR